MQIFDHHVIFDEITYDREELKDWYRSVEHYKNDYATVTNRNDSAGLSHNKKFQYGLFDTLDTKEKAGTAVIDYEPIKKLVEKFNFDQPMNETTVDVLIYRPNYYFHPHVDYHMNCGIMFPILPDEGMAPIDFYRLPPGATWERAKGYSRWLNFERDHIYSYHYSIVHPSMFNGETIHGVRNNENIRVFLRFKCLDMTFQQIIEKTKSGKFLNL
jgi:hypothetical protein